MKVVHVHRIRGIGGSERHLLTLLPALAERGVDVSFVGLDDPAGALDPFYRELSVPYERVPSPRDLDPALAVKLPRLLRSLRPDGSWKTKPDMGPRKHSAPRSDVSEAKSRAPAPYTTKSPNANLCRN